MQIKDESFDVLAHSPLSRAAETARVVWAERPGPVHALWALREVDLHGWEGLTRREAAARDPDAYAAWQHRPEAFALDGAWPVREVWARAREAWGQIEALASRHSAQSVLLVAHQGINKALLGTAMGLAPADFRRLPQVGGRGGGVGTCSSLTRESLRPVRIG